MRYDVGDHVVNPKTGTMYKIVDIGPDTRVSADFVEPPIVYHVRVIDPKNGHKNVLTKHRSYLESICRSATKAEVVLYGL